MKQLFSKALILFILLMFFNSCSSQKNDEVQVTQSNTQEPVEPQLEVYLRKVREISTPNTKKRKVHYPDSVLLYFSADTLYRIHYPYSYEKGIDYSINKSGDTLSVNGEFGWEHIKIKKGADHFSILSSLSDTTEIEEVYESIEMDSLRIFSIIRNKVNWNSFQKKWTTYGDMHRVKCELKTQLKNGLDLRPENKKNYSFNTDHLLYKTKDNEELKFQFVDGGDCYLHLNHTCNSRNCSTEIIFEVL